MPQGETAPFVFTVSTQGAVRAFAMNPETGALEASGTYDVQAPGGDFFLTASHDGRTVFVAYSMGVTALTFDPETEDFTLLDSATTMGGGTHVEVSPDTGHVFVAHYNEGKMTHLPYDPTAGFGTAQGFSPGQNSHSTRVHPSGRWAYVPCLGSNRIVAFNVAEANVTEATMAGAAAEGGPRHMVIHPTLDVAYVLSEKGGYITSYALDGTTGVIGGQLDRDTLGQVSGTNNWGSDVQVTPDGKHVYGVERNARMIYHFTVGDDGTLTAAGAGVDLGAVVRAYAVTPSGKFLQIGDQSGNLTTYAIATDGSLSAQQPRIQGLGDLQATAARDVRVGP